MECRFVERSIVNAIANAAVQNEFYRKCGGLNTFDQQFASMIGGYPKGAVLDYLDNGVLKRALSLRENNRADFTMRQPEWKGIFNCNGLDGINWADINTVLPDGDEEPAASEWSQASDGTISGPVVNSIFTHPPLCGVPGITKVIFNGTWNFGWCAAAYAGEFTATKDYDISNAVTTTSGTPSSTESNRTDGKVVKYYYGSSKSTYSTTYSSLNAMTAAWSADAGDDWISHVFLDGFSVWIREKPESAVATPNICSKIGLFNKSNNWGSRLSFSSLNGWTCIGAVDAGFHAWDQKGNAAYGLSVSTGSSGAIFPVAFHIEAGKTYVVATACGGDRCGGAWEWEDTKKNYNPGYLTTAKGVNGPSLSRGFSTAFRDKITTVNSGSTNPNRYKSTLESCEMGLTYRRYSSVKVA